MNPFIDPFIGHSHGRHTAGHGRSARLSPHSHSPARSAALSRMTRRPVLGRSQASASGDAAGRAGAQSALGAASQGGTAGTYIQRSTRVRSGVYSMTIYINIAGLSCRSCSGRSPRGFRLATGLGCCQIIYPSPKSQRSCPGLVSLGLGGGVSYGFVLLKNSFNMSGRIFTAALLEACSPFDALLPTLPSPSALLHVEVRRDSFVAGHDTNVGNT